MRLLRSMSFAMALLLVSAMASAWQMDTTYTQPRNADKVAIELWPGGMPANSGTPPRGPERIGKSGAVSNIGQPRIEIYRPAHPNGTAILIIGGGGYYQIGMGRESNPAARWLMALGVTPVVLYYRLPADGWKAVAPFQDGQRALRILRSRAAELNVDPRRIGVLGFSSGGNLAGILATRFADAFYAPADATDRQFARPDFVGLIYPVTSLQPPYDTTHSARELSTQADAATAYSVQPHVTGDTPPVFIAHTADDPIANVGASLELFDALRRRQVPSELHVFEQGGHGWGLGQPGTPVATWPRLFAAWAQTHGFFAADPHVEPTPR